LVTAGDRHESGGSEGNWKQFGGKVKEQWGRLISMILSASSLAGAISSPEDSRSGTESQKRKPRVNSKIFWIETATGTSRTGRETPC
jgi:hypothetical protein